MTTTVAAALFMTLLGGPEDQSVDTANVAGAVGGDRVTMSDSAAVQRGPRQSIAHVAVGAHSPRAFVGQLGDSVAQRPRAVEYSDWYYRRLAIHKAASYATVPLFVAEYFVGQELFDGDASSGMKSTHQALATGIGVLFGANTITGAWNLWDSRHESQGRARRITHSVLMLAADAGFVATASLAPEGDEGSEGNEGLEDGEGSSNRDTHRAVAIGSMAVALGSYLMMFFWK